jgi:hypothetical protein
MKGGQTMSQVSTLQKPLPLAHPARTGKWSSDPNHCSLLRYVSLTPGTMEDYRQLSRYHYRDHRVGPIAAVWTLRQAIPCNRIDHETIGVIVYTYPAPNAAGRAMALGCAAPRSSAIARLRYLNQNVRCISRVIIEPRWRGLGLATWLVRMTLPRLNVPVIESMALMGRFHPFLERAGMRRVEPPENPKAQDLRFVLQMLGIERGLWHDPRAVQARIDALPSGHQAWVDMQMHRFLGAFGCRRKMPPGVERTAFVLEKLCLRWSYFVWQNGRVNSGGIVG